MQPTKKSAEPKEIPPAEPSLIARELPPVIAELPRTQSVAWRWHLVAIAAPVAFAIMLGLALTNWLRVENVLANPGFELGTDGWEPSYGYGRLATTDETVHSGGQAIVSLGRSAHFCGPEQSLLDYLLPGETYVCSAWVRVRNGDEEPVKMTIRQRDGQGLRYHPISTTAASADTWRFFSGRFKLEPADPLRSLAIYIEGPRRGVDLLVDEVKVMPDRFLLLVRPMMVAIAFMAVGSALMLAFKRRWWSAGFGVAAAFLGTGLMASWLVDHRSAVVVGPAPDHAKAFARLGFQKVVRGEVLEIAQEVREPTLYLGTTVTILSNCPTDIAIVAKTAEIHGRVDGMVYFRGEKLTIMTNADVAGGIEANGQVIRAGEVADRQKAADLVAAGNAAARGADWRKAFECFQQIVATGKAGDGEWSAATSAALAAGDATNSLALCREMMDRFGQVQDPAVAEQCAKQCLVVPGISGELLEKAVERVEFSVNAKPNDRWRQLVKGMAEYRSGQWSNALEWLSQPERSSNIEISSMALPFGAMARYQLGDTNAAHDALEDANSRVKLIVEGGKLAKASYRTWDNYARAIALHAEAERLILGRENPTSVNPAGAENKPR